MSAWSYAGKTALVVGCHSGIGRATAMELHRLGAVVHGFDIAEGCPGLSTLTACDMRDPALIDAALDRLPSPLDALFYCAGLPQTFPAADIVKVNFVGARRLIQGEEPHLNPGAAIATVASTAGGGWMNRAAQVTEFVQTQDFDAAMAWYEARGAELGDPYAFTKEAMIVWVMRQSSHLIRRGFRLNCLSPGPTLTGMTEAFDSHAGAALIDVFTQPLGRRSTPEEQAYALIFLNSPAASYVNGLNLLADGGFTAYVASGQFDLNAAMSAASRS